MDDSQISTPLAYPHKITRSTDNLIVSEAVYWEKYYDHPDIIYEFNDGILEEKPVADFLNFSSYKWFLILLNEFLEVRPVAKTTGLEIGFRFPLPHNTVKIRRPDLGVVLDSNPVSLEPDDKTYNGIFDLCVESLSDSTQEDIERDTVDKKWEYAKAGVKEYYILDARSKHTAFYRLNARGVYVPIKPTKDGIIKSKALPGFQFRRADLYQKPSHKEMMKNVVYKGFVALDQQAEIKARRKAEAKAHQADAKALEEKQARQEETKARRKAEAKAHQAEAKAHQAEARALEEKQARQEETKARQKAEDEIARLKALLATKVE
jgi:Uma2 family endonuclease/ribosomal protein L14E/L6E/L27E